MGSPSPPHVHDYPSHWLSTTIHRHPWLWGSPWLVTRVWNFVRYRDTKHHNTSISCLGYNIITRGYTHTHTHIHIYILTVCTNTSGETKRQQMLYQMSVLVLAISSIRLRASNFSSRSSLDSRIFRSRSSSLPCTAIHQTLSTVHSYPHAADPPCLQAADLDPAS